MSTLDLTPPIQEYWVNIFEINKKLPISQKMRWFTKEAAIKTHFGGSKPIYRLHVKLKPKPKFNTTGLGYAEFVGD